MEEKKSKTSLAGTLKKWARIVLSFAVAERKCLCCGEVCYDMPVCKKCAEEKLLSDSLRDVPRCRICGRILLGQRETCTVCRTQCVLGGTDGVIALFPYRQWRKMLLFDWKMTNERSLSNLFALAANNGLKSAGLDRENCVLVPVPPRKGKIRAKGWDQVDELCNILSSSHGYTVVRLLERLSSDPQKKKNREGRFLSRDKVYGISPKWRRELSKWSKSVGKPGEIPEMAVIVDDVVTTGNTVAGCAEKIKGLGIRKVKVLSLFIVD